MTYDLSVLIPARNEQFLNRTIQDVLENRRTQTEIIVVLDGGWPVVPIPDHPDVTLIRYAEAIGQRAAVNEAARLSQARYVMKLDAHCALAPGFDVTLIENHQPDWIQVPRMYNLHAFDWVCTKCGNRQYQGAEGACPVCGGVAREMEIIWQPKKHATDYMWFDRDLIFRYFDNANLKPYGGNKEQYDHKLRDWAQGDITDLMTCLGACWFVERAHFWELGGLDEGHGSWGQMGTEIACKAWLSGGALKINKKTWFAHMFRTGNGFSFPYPLRGSDQERAREYSRRLWLSNRWEKAVRPLSWLIEKFSPLPGWEARQGDQAPKRQSEKKGLQPREKAILYYTDNRLDPLIQKAVWAQLEKAGLPVVSVSLQPIPFGENLVLEKTRGYLTMFEQILTGLEAIHADVVFFAEHDVLYHPSHFDFFPSRPDVYFYNENVWKVDYQTGRALFHFAQQTSGLAACRDLLLTHYRKRVELVRAHGFTRKMGFEPGTHGRAERVDDYKAEAYFSEFPNLDLRHAHNLTPSRWEKAQFRNQRYTRGWTEAESVPGWGKTYGEMQNLLQGVLDVSQTYPLDIPSHGDHADAYA